MKTIEITRLKSIDNLMDLEETCCFINLFHPREVDEFLEAYDNWGDNEFIVEMCDELKIPLVMVRETTHEGIRIHGYINKSKIEVVS